MFTGIIQAMAPIASLEKQDNLWRFGMKFSGALLENLQHGASVAHNGVCLTVAGQTSDIVYFDVMDETLKVTNLSQCQVGDVLNIERAMRYGDEVGGHILSGHVAMGATLIEREATDTNSRLRFSCDEKWMKYILPKGFAAIDGASLTIGEVGKNWFEVYLIPETRSLTTLDSKLLGSVYNIEIDSQTQAIVDTVERVMAQKFQQ
ncbi:riboflavin synthase subunit alpha [Psychrobium sp. MM17-31]|uniref:riboflavin synthase subunit alpha n=1 Tax=Psychrobium sp. MM17-31 TaxID=2917758 RepID=UPI001EF5BD33|nr:riboflavin synthase subunit alpha [Psychrobium sp. MM17-31]MCG7531512.1 riboflavin synthase subunit alpha [Psychrobium sp. MM17-31]